MISPRYYMFFEQKYPTHLSYDKQTLQELSQQKQLKKAALKKNAEKKANQRKGAPKRNVPKKKKQLVYYPKRKERKFVLVLKTIHEEPELSEASKRSSKIGGPQLVIQGKKKFLVEYESGYGTEVSDEFADMFLKRKAVAEKSESSEIPDETAKLQCNDASSEHSNEFADDSSDSDVKKSNSTGSIASRFAKLFLCCRCNY